MKIQEQNFGVEIELTGITRKAAAKTIANYFGTESTYNWNKLRYIRCHRPQRQNMEGDEGWQY